MHPLLAFCLSGLLFAVSFVYASCFWCFIPAFVFLLHGISLERSPFRLFIYGTLCGTIHYGGSFFWVWSTFPILWLSDAPVYVQLFAIGVYWVLTSLAMGVAGGVFAVTARFFVQRMWMVAVFMPVLWVASEVVRSFLFSVYAFGPGSFLNIGFSYGYLGYLLAEEPHLLQLSFLTGVYGLSYLAALIGSIAFILCRSSWRVQLFGSAASVALILALLVAPNAEVREQSPAGKQVIAIETYFDHEFERQENALELKAQATQEAVAFALAQNPDAIVLPEDVQFAEGFENSEALIAWARMQTASPTTIIVDSGPFLDDRHQTVLRSNMYDLRDGSVYAFDKQYLVPQGEYISYLHAFLLSFFLSNEAEEAVQHFARFRPGTAEDSELYPQHLPGILFCFETMVPYGVRRAYEYRHPDFIAHPISHAWFVDPFSLEYQLDDMLKVSAIWNDVPVVSAGSMTESKLFMPDGKVYEGEVLQSGERWKVRRFVF